jgi:hypothetical protein
MLFSKSSYPHYHSVQQRIEPKQDQKEYGDKGDRDIELRRGKAEGDVDCDQDDEQDARSEDARAVQHAPGALSLLAKVIGEHLAFTTTTCDIMFLFADVLKLSRIGLAEKVRACAVTLCHEEEVFGLRRM